MEFFRVKTGIPWEDRVTLAMTMPSLYFQYEPPVSASWGKQPRCIGGWLTGVQTGGKPLGRRLRFDSEYCQQINAELRGLPWPPVDDAQTETFEEADDPELVLEYEEGEGVSSFPTGEESAEEGAADGGDDQDARMEPGEDTIQEVQSFAGDVEVEDVPSTPASTIFDSNTVTESTAPSSQCQESDCGQSPEHHVAVDAEGSKDIAGSACDAESG